MWWSWSIWSFVGNVAQVVSLVAIVFVIRELVHANRVVGRFNWVYDAYATVSGPDPTMKYVEGELVILGQEDLRIFWIACVGCEYEPGTGHRISYRMNAQQPQIVRFGSHDFSGSWIVIHSGSLSDRRYASTLWLPLDLNSDLANERKRQMRLGYQRRWMFWRRYLVRQVGPGHGRAWIRTTKFSSRREKRFLEQQDELLAAVEATWVQPGWPSS